MPKYRVSMSTIVNQTVTVEADSEDEAAELAYEESTSGVCAQCSGWGKKWSLDFGEFEIDEDEVMPDGTVIKAVRLDDE